MGRIGSLAICLTFVACMAGPAQHDAAGTAVLDDAALDVPNAPLDDPGAPEAPDALLIAAPENLLRLSEQDLLDAMGDPAFVWTESDAQMWRYDADACALFVFLYPDGVRHVDLAGDELDAEGRDACFRELVARRI